MNIGAAARASGVSAKMIRSYEAAGLLRPAGRRANGYRHYGSDDMRELRFIGRARALGFSLGDIGVLMSLWRDRERPSREVREVAAGHLLRLERRIEELSEIALSLRQLVDACHGDSRPACPILEDLEAPEPL